MQTMFMNWLQVYSGYFSNREEKQLDEAVRYCFFQCSKQNIMFKCAHTEAACTWEWVCWCRWWRWVCVQPTPVLSHINSLPFFIYVCLSPAPLFFIPLRSPSAGVRVAGLQPRSLAGLLITPCLSQQSFIQMIKAVWRAIMTTGSDGGGGGGRAEAVLCLATRSASDRSLCFLNDFASCEMKQQKKLPLMSADEYIHIFKYILT